MSERLRALFDQELAELRRGAGDFARANPKIASRLRLSPDAVDDPHVSRLLEGVAFMAARIRQKLDDEFPELTNGLLGTLYPHLLAPFPSAAIVQFDPPAGLDDMFRLPVGTVLEMEQVEGENCLFRTTQEVELWPIALRRAELGGRPLVAPNTRLSAGSASCLRLVIESLDPGRSLADLGFDRLRLCLRGQSQQAAALYQLLFSDLVGVALADHTADQAAVVLGPDAVKPVGFAPGEVMLPGLSPGLAGHQLLTEFLAFPAKFLFFDLTGLSAKLLRGAGSQLEVFFYFKRHAPELAPYIAADSLALGCAPAVNLFEQRAEPVPLTHESAEYLVVPDMRRFATREVFSVDRVQLVEGGKPPRPVAAFWGDHHPSDSGQPALFWTATRRAAGSQEPTEVTLSVVDSALGPASPDDGVLTVETTCLNADLPARIPYGGGSPRLSLVEGAAQVAQVRCLTPPTPTLRPSHAAWRLVSQLSLNHLSLTGGIAGAEALREILRLHDLRDAPETRALIDGVRGVRAARGVARLPETGAMCRGTDVELELDPGQVDEGMLYLFATVLDRFLALYASVNAFSRLTARLSGRESAPWTLPARAGARVLL